MKINVSTLADEQDEFEKNAWSDADKEHYGHEVNWNKKNFHITALENGDLVGSLRFDIRAGVAYIDSVIVDKGSRGKGIGSALLVEAERLAKENNAHKIYLQAGEQWDSIRLYKKLGYIITSRLPNHYEKINFLEMTKFI